MVKQYQHPAGAGCSKKRKIASVFLWLIIYGLRIDAFSAVEVGGNHNLMKAASNSDKQESKSKISENSFDDVYASNKQADLDRAVLNRISRAVPLQKTGSESSSENESKNNYKSDYVLKVPLSVLRNYEFYRLLRALLEEDIHQGDNHKRNTVIPVPRLGRSDAEDTGDTESAENKFLSKKHDTVIPMVRFGRGIFRDGRSGSNSVIPYPRIGRSILDESNLDNFEEEYDEYETLDIEDDAFLKSGNVLDQNINFFEDSADFNMVHKRDGQDYDTIIPYPRPGRNSETNRYMERHVKKEDPEYILPQIRYGRSMLLLSPPKMEEPSKDKPTHTFVLPYPRPGRSNKYTKTGESKIGDLSLPYPRPGRSNFPENYGKMFKFHNNEYMLPTARLGRSSFDSFFEAGKDSGNLEESFLGLKFNPLSLKPEQKNLSERLDDKNESGSFFVIPYPRPGKKSMLQYKSSNQRSNKVDRDTSDYVLPYPRPGKRTGKQKTMRITGNKNQDNENTDAQNFMLPYPRPGREIQNLFNDENSGESDITKNKNNEIDAVMRSDHLRLKRSTAVVPYPRIGKSNSIIPHPRLGKRSSGTSTISVGQSNSVIPYPRLGRSKSVVPYPRLGRSNSVVPYPRLGRSTVLIPYPRPGRSSSVVPYPRPGRSDSVVPYPRPGRSDSIVPYLRPGRSTLQKPVSSNKYAKADKMETWLLPNLRPGRSSTKKDDHYVVPYPRPGRSSDDGGLLHGAEIGYAESEKGLEEDILYSRPYRSKYNQGYILPHPRVGRSYAEEKNKADSTDSSSIISYPQHGILEKQGTPSPETMNSIHKLNKHMLPSVDDSIYLLPYPRPGRYSE